MSTRKLNEIEMHPRYASLSYADYTIEDEADIYEAQLQEVYDNVRQYLDSLDYLRMYKVRWKDYKRSKTPTMPYKYTLKGRK